MEAPLAERIRPKKLEEYISQLHLVGPNGALTQQITKGSIPSLLFWGSPGTGKTTLAQIIAQESGRPFYELSAINAGVKDIREVIEKAKNSGGMFTAKNPILFIDEIHRFSKSQQDSLLAAVEKGWITLIGATTENPSFEVIPALLSRCQVYILNPFSKDDLLQLLDRAMKEDVVLKLKKINLAESEALLRLSGGDGRKLLNIFELVVNASAEDEILITNEKVLQLVQQNILELDGLHKNSFFNHPYFKNLKLKQTRKFLVLHTNCNFSINSFLLLLSLFLHLLLTLPSRYITIAQVLLFYIIPSHNLSTHDNQYSVLHSSTFPSLSLPLPHSLPL